MLVFEEREKLVYPEKNHLEQRREPTTNSVHIIMVSMPGLNPNLIGGRQVLLPLSHLCFPDGYIKQFFTVSDVPLAVKNYFCRCKLGPSFPFLLF